MSQSSDDRMTELRQLFFESAQELLQALNDEALKLEKCPGDVEIVRSIRRAVHTLKGDAAACGYREVSELAHEFEDALALESALAHAQLSEVAFKAADTFSGMLEAYRDGKKLPSAQSLREMIARLTNPATDTPVRRKTAREEEEIRPGYEGDCDRRLSSTPDALDRIRATIHPGSAEARQTCLPGQGPDRPALRNAHRRTATDSGCTRFFGRDPCRASGSRLS